jgi:hypothetical protein
MPVSFIDLDFAFEFANTGGFGENEAYLDRETGKFHFRSDAGDPEEEELPEDIESEKYLRIPDRRDLDLGTCLVFRFVEEVMPDDYQEVRDMFRHKGAYGRFKAFLVGRRALDRWHAYSAKAQEEALRQWCADNRVELAD